MKNLKLNLLVIAMVSLAFASCNNPKPEKYDGTTVFLKQAVCAGDIRYDGIQGFVFSFETVEGIIGADKEVAKSGIMYDICLYSPSATTVENGFVVAKEGTYDLDKLGKGTSMTIDGAANASACYVVEINPNVPDTTTTKSSFTEGKVTISKVAGGYRFDAVLTGSDGVLHKFRYEGNLSAIEDAFTYEPKTPTTKKYEVSDEFELYVNDNYGDYYGLGVDDVIFAPANEDWDIIPTIELFLPLNSGTTIPVGTYPINNTRAANTAWASVGNIGWFDLGCFVWDRTEGMTTYYIVSGSVEVTTTGFHLVGKSRYGSDIEIIYTGSLEVLDRSSEFAPAKIKMLRK